MRVKTARKSSTKKDDLLANTASRGHDFEFTARVAEVFDDMLVRSVPFYVEQQAMIRELARKAFIRGTSVYDLGCSTATTLVNLGLDFKGKAKQIIGLDNSKPMLAKAREKLAAHGLAEAVTMQYADLNEEFTVREASVVTMCWTMQFIRPPQRHKAIRRIYEGLVDHGALIVTEKVLANNGELNRTFIERYYDYKRRNQYSDEEIARKREALENVLVPYRIQENIELFRAGGFQSIDTFFQWYNFVGFVCVKQPAGT